MGHTVSWARTYFYRARKLTPTDVHYLFAYPEGYENGQSVAWTTRQTCVFHRFDPSGNENLWIFLHAGPRTKLQTAIEADISSGVFSAETSWCSFHLLALATYLWNWRWYIRYLGDGIERIVSHVRHWTLGLLLMRDEGGNVAHSE